MLPKINYPRLSIEDPFDRFNDVGRTMFNSAFIADRLWELGQNLQKGVDWADALYGETIPLPSREEVLSTMPGLNDDVD